MKTRYSIRLQISAAFQRGGPAQRTLESSSIVDLTAPAQQNRYGRLAWYPTTDEVGAAADGSATQPMSIGHTQGITASNQYLYVGDGPHGVSAWQIAEVTGAPIDTPRLVGNTVQNEYPVSVGGETVYPATHASMVVYDEASQSLLSRSGCSRC